MSNINLGYLSYHKWSNYFKNILRINNIFFNVLINIWKNWLWYIYIYIFTHYIHILYLFFSYAVCVWRGQSGLDNNKDELGIGNMDDNKERGGNLDKRGHKSAWNEKK